MYLRVRIEQGENSLSLVTRTLETIIEQAPNPMEANVQTQVLSALRLALDSSGNPTAYDGDKLLDRSELTASFIDPVRKAVGDT